MRALIFPLALLPLPALADSFTLPSRPTEAVIYPHGGMVTHEVRVSVPAGRHEVVLPDLPAFLPLDSLRVSADGLQLGAIRYRTDFVPPRDTGARAEIDAAEARIEEIQDRMRQVRDTAARLELERDAAKARIAFLTGLGDRDTLPGDAESLRALAAMVADETLAAQQAAFDAEIRAREERKQLDDLKEELADAEAALKALVPESDDRPFLAIDVAAAEGVENTTLRVSFFAQALSWQPAYDLRLSEGDAPRIVIARGAEVYQETGENWEDVRLTLSTQRPADQIEPSYLPEDLRRLVSPDQIRPLTRSQAAPESAFKGADLAEAAPAMEAPVAAPSFQGLSVIYDFPETVDVASGADSVRIPFDEMEFDAELVARAVPFGDDVAYLVARFTNESAEPLLPTSRALRYFDGGLVGAGPLPQIAAGEEAELGFGPIEGVQLTRTVLQRAEGDRGLISRSNEQSERVRIEVENLTDRSWNLELLDRVPYSEQEDLEITYSANPQPDIRAVEERRGILQWNTDLAPGATFTVETEFRMTWPDGQMVR